MRFRKTASITVCTRAASPGTARQCLESALIPIQAVALTHYQYQKADAVPEASAMGLPRFY